MEVNTHFEYEKILNPENDNEKWKLLLEKAINTRNFEIELYWKRTTYYWTINGAIFAANALLESSKFANKTITFGVSCFGVIFSLAWLLTNKGSKFWQVNWEKHIEIIEDKVMGPLFKTTLNYADYSKLHRLINPTQPFPFSVSKINSIISAFTTIYWIILFISKSRYYYSFDIQSYFIAERLLFIFTIISCISFVIHGQTGLDYTRSRNRNKASKINFITRQRE